MMKIIIKLFLLLALIVGLVVLGISTGVINISHKTEDSAGPINLLSRINGLGNLELIKFNVNSVIEDTIKKEISSSLNIPAVGKTLTVLNGEVSACINLKEVEQEDIKAGDSVLITLPSPQLCSTRINYDQSKIYDSHFNGHALTQNIIEKFFPGSDNNLKAEAIRLGILDQAKVNAKKVFSLLENKNEKKVNIIFKE